MIQPMEKQEGKFLDNQMTRNRSLPFRKPGDYRQLIRYSEHGLELLLPCRVNNSEKRSFSRAWLIKVKPSCIFQYLYFSVLNMIQNIHYKELN